VRNGYDFNIWGADPASQCTGNNFYGCERTSGAGGNYLNPVKSARLRTAETFSFRYGRVEVKAKLPVGKWIWPAIWLLPRHAYYGTWPASGEIDVVESRGNLNYPKEFGGGPESIGSTLHWGPDFFTNQFAKTHKVYSLPSGTFGDDFHTFGLYWDQNKLYTYVDSDSNRVLEVDFTQQSMWERGQFPSSYENIWANRNNSAPFDQEYYLILNVAVGGTSAYFQEGVDGKTWSNQSPNAINQFWDTKDTWYSTWHGEDVAMKVDSVKVWKFTDSVIN